MASEDLSEETLYLIDPDAVTASDAARLLAEVRRRRALDLTPFERVVIESLRRTIAADPLTDQAALAVLDKLLSPAG